MLKIIDNVDLEKLQKILYKYDARLIYSCDEYTGESYISEIRKQIKPSIFKFNGFNYPKVQEEKCYFVLDNGVLKSTGDIKDSEDLFYDLIKDNLVEKIRSRR